MFPLTFSLSIQCRRRRSRSISSSDLSAFRSLFSEKKTDGLSTALVRQCLSPLPATRKPNPGRVPSGLYYRENEPHRGDKDKHGDEFSYWCSSHARNLPPDSQQCNTNEGGWAKKQIFDYGVASRNPSCLWFSHRWTLSRFFFFCWGYLKIFPGTVGLDKQQNWRVYVFKGLRSSLTFTPRRE